MHGQNAGLEYIRRVWLEPRGVLADLGSITLHFLRVGCCCDFGGFTVE